eukprot:COSAG01_NODE_29518_length_635_cov_3.805970_2_plen_88_part_00
MAAPTPRKKRFLAPTQFVRGWNEWTDTFVKWKQVCDWCRLPSRLLMVWELQSTVDNVDAVGVSEAILASKFLDLRSVMNPRPFSVGE